MKTVYKYPLENPDDIVTISMPEGAEILTVQVQGDTPCIWALVDPDAIKRDRRFRWAGTGHPITQGIMKYVGTFQLHGGALVFHLFDLGYV